VFKHCPRYNKRTMKNRKIVENDILANQKYISMVRFAFQIRADCLLRIVFKINIKHLEVPSFFDTYIYKFFFFFVVLELELKGLMLARQVLYHSNHSFSPGICTQK
jgi:hypothetical protein